MKKKVKIRKELLFRAEELRMKKKVKIRKELLFRAEELKGLEEQRADLLEEMKTLTETVEIEKRAFTEEEETTFSTLEQKIQAIDKTIEAKQRARNLNTTKPNKGTEKETQEELEERAFAAYIRGIVLEERAGDVNLTMGDNGAVIPQTIAQKIIKKVVDICPIYAMATKYNVKGTLSIPYYSEETNAITMSYADEFTELESSIGKFTNIELNGFLAGALAKVSKSLVNNSQFDIVSHVVTCMAETISRFIEKEFIHGTIGKIEGLIGVKQTVTAAAANKVTMDEVIKLKDSIKDAFQQGACFIMNSDTRTAIRLLKDNNGRYLMQDDITSPFGTTLLGKPVYVTDNMGGMKAGETAIFYGDFSGLAVKLSENANVEVLREKFATQHAIGVVAWMEFDAKVENTQKIAKLVMKASA